MMASIVIVIENVIVSTGMTGIATAIDANVEKAIASATSGISLRLVGKRGGIGGRRRHRCRDP
jgi:hypothetical protein